MSPDMARAVADRLGVPVDLRAVRQARRFGGCRGVGCVGYRADRGPSRRRAEKIAFTSAYVEIQSTYLVPAGSPLTTIASVDQPGHPHRDQRTQRAYGLWLTAQYPATRS